MYIANWSRNLKGYDYAEEAGHVDEQSNSFKHWKSSCKDSIEGDRKDDDRDREKSAVIAVPHVVLHIERNQALDHASNHEAYAGQVDLPAHCAQPA